MAYDTEWLLCGMAYSTTSLPWPQQCWDLLRGPKNQSIWAVDSPQAGFAMGNVAKIVFSKFRILRNTLNISGHWIHWIWYSIIGHSVDGPIPVPVLMAKLVALLIPHLKAYESFSFRCFSDPLKSNKALENSCLATTHEAKGSTVFQHRQCI